MASRVVLAFRTELLDHDHDHWCLDCKQATGIRIFMMIIFGERMHLQVRLWCMECAGLNIVATDEPRHCG